MDTEELVTVESTVTVDGTSGAFEANRPSIAARYPT